MPRLGSSIAPDGQQLQGFVRLAGVAIEVDEPRLDDRRAHAAALGVGEQRDRPAGAALRKGERRLFDGPGLSFDLQLVQLVFELLASPGRARLAAA